VADNEAVEQETEDQEPEEQEEPHSLSAINDKIDALAEKVERLVSRGTSRGSTGTKASEAADVAEQVRAEVSKLKTQEDASAATNDRFDKIEKGLKKLAERPPIEFRKITQMLWGDPE
jgi:hypothetical protein